MIHVASALVLAILFGVASTQVAAKDRVRVVDSQGTVFDHYAVYQAKAEGYYEAENLDVSIVVGRGGSESLQAVLTGSADIIYGTGVLGVINAYAKGAPVVILGNARRGAGDSFWYVRSVSPIKSFKDLDGRHLTYSSPGSFTNLLAQTIAREFGVRPRFVATGSMTATRTQLMSGQVDTGWAGYPIALDLIRAGEVRIIGTGDESPLLRGMTMRVIAANADWLAKNQAAAMRAMRAFWKGQQFNFSGEAAIRRYAEHWKVDLEDAKRAGEFFKIEDLTFNPIGKLDELLKLAQDYEFLKEPLTEAQKRGLVKLIYDPAGR